MPNLQTTLSGAKTLRARGKQLFGVISSGMHLAASIIIGCLTESNLKHRKNYCLLHKGSTSSMQEGLCPRSPSVFGLSFVAERVCHSCKYHILTWSSPSHISVPLYNETQHNFSYSLLLLHLPLFSLEPSPLALLLQRSPMTSILLSSTASPQGSYLTHLPVASNAHANPSSSL